MNNNIFPNTFKAALAAHQIQIGCWSALANPISTEVLGLAGFDWLVLDGEHAPNDISTFIPQLMALKGSASAPVVRVPTNDPVIVKRLLDIGFYNFLIPFVETQEQAALAVASTRYPPEGIRGVSVSHRANMFGTVPDYFAQSNSNITVLVQIESQQGLITSTLLQPQTVWTVSLSAQAIWLPPLATWAMPATLTCSVRSSTYLLAPKHTVNRAAYWRRLKPTPDVIWSGEPPLLPSAAISGCSAQRRRN
jgi:2-dehydro-3-deoxyglucarate aldolase